MNVEHKNEETAIWKELITSSVDKCINKLSKISKSKWSISQTKISSNTLDEIIRSYIPKDGPGVCIYFEITGVYPWIAMITLEPEDVEIISKIFFGNYHPKISQLNYAEELILAEFGNVILNSMVGSISNVLQKPFLPSVPKCVQGKTEHLMEAFKIILQAMPRHKIIIIELKLTCDNLTSKSEILGVIPENLEKEINATLPKKS